MEINRLKQFSAICRTGNLRRAAELLQASPGSLSKSMKLLQAQVDSPLFVQSGRGIVITESGHRLYALAQRVISEHDRMLAAVATKRGVQAAPLRLASFEIFTTYFTAALANDHFAGRPMTVLERVPGQIEQSVLSREADLGLTYAPIPHPELDFLKIAQYEKRIYVRKGAFKNTRFEEIPFTAPVTLVSGSPTGLTDLDGWPADIPRKAPYQFEMLETALEVCRLGLAAIFCPEFVIPLQNQKLRAEFQLEALPPPRGMGPVRRTVYIVKRKSDPESSELKKLARAVRMVCSVTVGSRSKA